MTEQPIPDLVITPEQAQEILELTQMIRDEEKEEAKAKPKPKVERKGNKILIWHGYRYQEVTEFDVDKLLSIHYHCCGYDFTRCPLIKEANQ